MRSSSISLAALLVAAGLTGSSLAAVSITATDTFAWNGRAVPTTPSGFTWSWNTATPNTPVIDAAGRVYFVGRFISTPAIGTIGANAGPNAIFSATNGSDMALFNNIYDSADMGGGVLVGQQNSTNVFNLTGLNSSSLRVSGSRVGFGLGIQGTGINNSTNTTTGALQNNSVFQTGTFADGISTAQQRAGAMILKDVSGAAATGFQGVEFKSIGTQSLSFNASGSMAWIGGVSAAAGSGGGVGQFLTTSPTAAPFGNSGFIALRDASGSVSVLAQAGESTPGGGRYANGTSGVGVRGFDVRMNRNGQVYWDAQLLNAGTVSSTNDNRAFIHTPSSGTVQVYREGLAAPSSGGSLFTGGPAITFRSFSNAGLLFVGNLATGTGDVQTADAANNNSSGLYITDGAGATTLVARRTTSFPGLRPATTFASARSQPGAA